MIYEKYLPQEMAMWLEGRKEITDVTLIAGKNMFVVRRGIIEESNFPVTRAALNLIVERMCRGSVYASQGTIKRGYITIDGGSRVGVVGSCVTDESGKVTHMRDIIAINIRIAREIVGAADGIMGYIKEGTRVYNSLLIAPPSRGKTTILRDAARQLGDVMKCAIADERSEIAGCEGGRVNCDVGKYTVVADGCPKKEGMMMLLRSMAPEVILTDEIGGEEDEEAIVSLMNVGVKIICTAHGYDEGDVMRRRGIRLLMEKGVFERLIVLSSIGAIGEVKKVIDVRRNEKW
ncbi:MAG: stage III sporulation protein AA [Clostridia bacterium]|nr:stage III sporulation protein AA [Clostridia bacterium]